MSSAHFTACWLFHHDQVGYDAHSYAYRDVEGSKVHRALREPYGRSFAEGDVVGCYLHLPPGGRPFEPRHQVHAVWL